MTKVLFAKICLFGNIERFMIEQSYTLPLQEVSEWFIALVSVCWFGPSLLRQTHLWKTEVRCVCVWHMEMSHVPFYRLRAAFNRFPVDLITSANAVSACLWRKLLLRRMGQLPIELYYLVFTRGPRSRDGAVSLPPHSEAPGPHWDRGQSRDRIHGVQGGL